ncbi:MAG: GTP pyrophosphokinase family protein [Sphingorhabdus sp.]
MTKAVKNSAAVKILRAEYTDDLITAKKLCECLNEQLQSLVDVGGLTLGLPIETRVKEWASIEDKLSRKSTAVKSIRDLGDFVGARAILLFKSDAEQMAEAIKKTFQIISDEDVAERLRETQFGYQSRHFLVKIPDAWCEIPSYAGLNVLQAEIQVRTVAQHIWAAASHKLQYKREDSVPPQLRRAIHRASALLETVDLEFERVLSDRNKYLSETKQSTEPNSVLNVELISLIAEEMLPAENKSGDENYDDLLLDFKKVGITTISDLRDLIEKNLDYAISEDKRCVKEYINEDWVDSNRINKGVYFVHTGLIRNMLDKKFGKTNMLSIYTQRNSSEV